MIGGILHMLTLHFSIINLNTTLFSKYAQNDFGQIPFSHIGFIIYMGEIVTGDKIKTRGTKLTLNSFMRYSHDMKCMIISPNFILDLICCWCVDMEEG
jgi:hypothetical protein